MDELVIPEIIFKDFRISCLNENCESYGVVLIVQASEQCQEIICGPCGVGIQVTAL